MFPYFSRTGVRMCDVMNTYQKINPNEKDLQRDKNWTHDELCDSEQSLNSKQQCKVRPPSFDCFSVILGK